MHPLLKRGLEKAVASSAVNRVTRYRVRRKRLILAYHGIIPEGAEPAGERVLFVRQGDFAKQLDMLAEIADVAPLDRIDDPGGSRPRVAITFDDAYRGAVNEGVSELVKRSLPATIFVAPGRLDDHVFWWDALSHGKEAIDQTVRTHALQQLDGSDERIRQWAAATAVPASDALPSYAHAATRDELAAAVRHPGITVGSHSWSHRNLALLGDADLFTEVRQSYEWLRARFGDKAISWFAYPYGLDSAAARLAVVNAAYSGAVRAEGGWHRPEDVSPFARPRFSVGPGLSLAGLHARLVGARLT